MELLSNNDYIVLKQSQYSLWCSRTGAEPAFKSIIVNDSSSYESFVCHGLVHGLIGVFQSDKLLLIKERQSVGVLPLNHEVFKIQKIVIVSLSSADPIGDLSLETCRVHDCTKQAVESAESLPPQSTQQSSGVQKTWNQIKMTASHVKPRVMNRTNLNESKDKCEKRILDELYKMFNDTDSFYYSLTGDLTNCVQRQQKQQNANKNIPLWKRVDDRFFWNKVMLRPLMDCHNELTDNWILPIIQGYVKIEKCCIDLSDPSQITADCKSLEDVRIPTDQQLLVNQECYLMILISRRSRFRAGTRYKRRGVDDDGKCANYVETEQIFQFGSHIVSFVAIRGSVPIYWSQIGHKYRPPPRIDRNEEETQIAFNKHFSDEINIYGNQVVVNLVEKTGREKIINDAYLNHVLNLDSPDVTYVSFDFHDYCRGMRFENVSILIDSIKDIIKDMRYCWVDNEGMICEQRGVFRINCIDCLDRTNIVMTAIARTVMDTQFVRLGLLPPEGQLSPNCRRVFQMMWANNGDIISRQYAGTVALKGDYTRTGERRITGVMKDGYHSASRYYLNRFKDAYRQATIDLMQGLTTSEDLNSPESETATDSGLSSFSEQEYHERVKMVIEDCKKILIPETEVILGGWPLIDADPTTGSTSMSDTDMDTVLVLTKDCYYVAEYDDQTDRIVRYQKVLLEDLEKIELGPEPNQLFSMKSSQCCCVRFHYCIDGISGYFHMFRSTNTRFFNNMAIPIRNSEEAVESLKAIVESFKVALSVKELNVPYYEGKLDRRKSKLTNINRDMVQNHHLKVSQGMSMTRNTSEGQLTSLKSVGSRAITGVYSQFSRLKGKWSANEKPKTIREGSPPKSISVAFNVDSSGEEDSEEDASFKKPKKSKIQNLPVTGLHTSAERTFSSDYSECSDIEDQELIIDSHITTDIQTSRAELDRVLESCGILATSPPLRDSPLPTDSDGMVIKTSNKSVFHEVDDFVLDAMKKASLKQLHRKASQSSISLSSQSELRTYPSTPLIHIDDSISTASDPLIGSDSFGTKSTKMLSKSSENLESTRSQKVDNSQSSFRTESVACLNQNESSHSMMSRECSLGSDMLNTSTKMKTSHSENAIQDFSSTGLSLNLPNPLTTPLNVKKDLVLSPLSRIAKGVQHLGINIRGGLIGSEAATGGQQPSVPVDSEAYRLLQERKNSSKSRIIEL